LNLGSEKPVSEICFSQMQLVPLRRGVHEPEAPAALHQVQAQAVGLYNLNPVENP
jgi:hypothetical protein